MANLLPLFFTVVFSGLSGYAWYRGASEIAVYACLFAALMVGFATLRYPLVLRPYNKLWFHFGEVMGRIISPLILGVFFFVLLTPVSVASRLFGRDELRLKKRKIDSYWIDRVPPGPVGDSFKNQF
jgi:Saxitoxin biosynthesis operon protein SxtJ